MADMNAQESWQAALQQLRLDMSRASFEKLLRDTEVVSLEDDVLTVRTPDQTTCEWLEARLKSTVERMLVGIMDRAVTIQFVASQGVNHENDESDLLIEPVQWLDYDKVVQPHRQVVVKGYLRRLGKEVGAKAVWLYIGFHQAAWMAHDAGSSTGAILHSRDVMRFSGLSTGAFWRALGQPAVRDALWGLVQRVDPPAARRYRRGRDGRPHRAPVRYRVYMTPRLTRADARGLHCYLKRLLEVAPNIEDGLRQCLEIEDILSVLDAQMTSSTAPSPQTVMDIAQKLNAAPLSQTAERLAQELHRRIVNSLGDIHITHYFILHGIRQSELTPAQAWLVTAARDMAYINARTGERREDVTFQRGYEEMARLVGSKRPKTVQAWFSPDWAAHRWGGNLGLFMREVEGHDAKDYADLRAATMPRTFRVRLEEPLDASGGNSVDAKGGNRLDANGTDSSDADGGNIVGADGGVKNSIKHRLNTDRESTSNTAGAAAPASWDARQLLQQNHVHPRVQQQLLDAQVSARAIVSWILYAAGNEARWISDPLGYAISRLRMEPRQGAGAPFDRLAALRPGELRVWIDRALQNPFATGGQIDSRENRVWPATMSSTPRVLNGVRDILFGEGGRL